MEIKPILFSTEMVQAIKRGQKTCTRRVIRPHYKKDEVGFRVVTNAHTGEFVRVEKIDENESAIFADGTEREVFPPYNVGDILWVRETWCKAHVEFGENPDGSDAQYLAQGDNRDLIVYKDDAISKGIGVDGVTWKPSIFMPHAAARIFLRVTDVRAERLQDIECIATEGVTMLPADNKRDPRCYFTYLWDSTIKKPDLQRYGWDANPWVWVIKFEKCERPKGWCE